MTWRGTPGPWTASDRTDSHEIYAAAYPGRPIAHVGSYWQGPGPDRDERAANAEGIAAVPQLVEAAMQARLLIGEGGQKAELSAAQREGNMNQAWHLLDDALRAAKVLP